MTVQSDNKKQIVNKLLQNNNYPWQKLCLQLIKICKKVIILLFHFVINFTIFYNKLSQDLKRNPSNNNY